MFGGCRKSDEEFIDMDHDHVLDLCSLTLLIRSFPKGKHPVSSGSARLPIELDTDVHPLCLGADARVLHR